jgi:hypothetical protein
LLLALIYRVHGIDPDAVLPYHLLLAAVTAAAMVFTGELLWGRVGGVAALAGVIGLGNGRELHYSVYQLLTENLATCIVTLLFCAAAWAKRRSPRHEAWPGLAAAVGMMVRPALIFVPIAYALFILLEPRERRIRIAAFLTPVVLVVVGWSGYVSTISGHFVLLSDAGKVNFVAGADPALAAAAIGLPAPGLDRRSLEEFWTRFPGLPPEAAGAVAQAVRRLPSRWQEYARITFVKLQVGVQRLPDTMWLATLVGLALAGSVTVTPECLPGRGRGHQVVVEPGGVFRRRWIMAVALSVAAGGLVLAILGFSHPVLEALFWALPLLCPLLRVRLTRAAEPAAMWPHWLLTWYVAYLLMILTTFAIPRFTRPFLPAFYLLAAMAVPLLAVTIAALSESRIGATDFKLGEGWR